MVQTAKYRDTMGAAGGGMGPNPRKYLVKVVKVAHSADIP